MPGAFVGYARRFAAQRALLDRLATTPRIDRGDTVIGSVAATGRSRFFALRSDRRGRFRLEAQADGEGVWAWHPDYGAVFCWRRGLDTVRVVLGGGGEISGRVVTADGAPAAGAVVRLDQQEFPGGPARPLRPGETELVGLWTSEVIHARLADRRGEFSFRLLGPGAYAVDARCGRLRARGIAARPGDREVRLVVEEGVGDEGEEEKR